MDIHSPDSVPPAMYCRTCGYILAGLSRNRCPECGRPFNPADPRTFRRKPLLSGPGLWVKRIALIIAAVVVGFLLLEAGVTGWYYRGWRAEQPLIAQIRKEGGKVNTTFAGPRWVTRLLNRRVQFVLDRVYQVEIVDANLDDAALQRLRALPELGSVMLLRSTICRDGLRLLKAIRQMRNLSLLDCPLDGIGLQHLKDIPGLRMFYLMASPGSTAPKPDYRFLADLKQVEDTWITTPLDDTDLQYVGQMTALRQLRFAPEPALSRQPISDAGLAQLAGLTQLRQLNLAFIPVTGPGLTALQSMSSLESLSLPYTHLTDEGLVHIKGLKNLQSLSLSGTNITDAGLPNLAGLARLRTLTLYKTAVSDAGLASLTP